MSKKSARVPATFVATVAAYLMSQGCGGPDVVEVRRCTDDRGYVLPDRYCTDPYYYHGYYGSYHYYGTPTWGYGGSSVSGGYVSGYRRSPSDGANIVTPSGTSVGRASGGTVSRGGFGGSSSSNSGSFGS